MVYLADLGSRTDGTELQCRRGMEVSNRTTDARGFRDYIRLFRAVEHEGGRTWTTAPETHTTWREGCMKAERIYRRRQGQKDATAHNALFLHYFLPSLARNERRKEECRHRPLFQKFRPEQRLTKENEFEETVEKINQQKALPPSRPRGGRGIEVGGFRIRRLH